VAENEHGARKTKRDKKKAESKSDPKVDLTQHPPDEAGAGTFHDDLKHAETLSEGMFIASKPHKSRIT
jgi:hypothetical protein